MFISHVCYRALGIIGVFPYHIVGPDRPKRSCCTGVLVIYTWG